MSRIEQAKKAVRNYINNPQKREHERYQILLQEQRKEKLSRQLQERFTDIMLQTIDRGDVFQVKRESGPPYEDRRLKAPLITLIARNAIDGNIVLGGGTLEIARFREERFMLLTTSEIFNNLGGLSGTSENIIYKEEDNNTRRLTGQLLDFSKNHLQFMVDTATNIQKHLQQENISIT